MIIATNATHATKERSEVKKTSSGSQQNAARLLFFKVVAPRRGAIGSLPLNLQDKFCSQLNVTRTAGTDDGIRSLDVWSAVARPRMPGDERSPLDRKRGPRALTG